MVIHQGGEATLRACNLSGCDQTAIKITHGSLNFEGGSIEDYKLYGVMMGEQKMAEKKDIHVVLKDVTLKAESSEVAVIAFRGDLDLQGVVIDGARYGLYLDGQTFEEPADQEDTDADPVADEPTVTVTASGTRFKNQAAFGVVAVGETQLVMDKATQTSLNASNGLKASPPAQVVVDERDE
jgi:hypothetical protein